MLSPKIKSNPINLTKRRKTCAAALIKSLISVANSLENLRFNSAVAQIYEFTNDVSTAVKSFEKDDAGQSFALREALSFLVQMFAPMMPHLAEECWERLLYNTQLVDSHWPEANPALLIDDMITIAVQVNGKRRDELSISPNAAKDEIEKAALELENVKRSIEGKQIKKVIVVPKRIVNIVI